MIDAMASKQPVNVIGPLIFWWVLGSVVVDWRYRARGGVPPTKVEKMWFWIVFCVWIGIMILGWFLAGNPSGFEGDMTALFVQLPLGIWEFRRWRVRRSNPRPKPATPQP
jgi:hypothetical protein